MIYQILGLLRAGYMDNGPPADPLPEARLLRFHGVHSGDLVDPEDPNAPAWANPGGLYAGKLEHGEGPYRKCPDCEVTWRGEIPCWSCGESVAS